MLVVDDDASVRSFARLVLSRAGYEVLEAPHGAEALRICADPGVSMDIVLSDVFMPHVSGVELADYLAAMRPAARVLLMSGFVPPQVVPGIERAGIVVLEKPFSPNALLEAIDAAVAERAKKPLTVLVVDDEALLRWALTELLHQAGHTVIEASSAHEARDVIARAPRAPDIVLLDYQLPDSTDLRLLDELRRYVGAVIMMTAFDTPEMIQDALRQGAYCVLTKPFDLQRVDRVIMDAHRVDHRP